MGPWQTADTGLRADANVWMREGDGVAYEVEHCYKEICVLSMYFLLHDNRKYGENGERGRNIRP